MTAQKAPRLPKKEMLAWLKSRESWNHEEWMALLAQLRQQGFEYWTDTNEGRQVLGEYLEANRKS